jgi:flagellar FliL protein
MAKAADKAAAKQAEAKPKGGVLKLAVGAIALLLVGAGGAYGAFAAGLLGGTAEHEPDVPKLVRKGDSDPYEAPGGKQGKEEGKVVLGEGGSEYRTAYYSFEESFTSNLADTSGMVQVDLAVSTRHDGRVLQWVKAHELAIRSAVLAQLAATPEDDVYDANGRKQLAERLTKAINEVLEANEGFGGIDAVHFKAFLVQ